MKRIVLFLVIFFNCINNYAQKSMGFVYTVNSKETFVRNVFKNGPAAKAGIKIGDIIQKVDDVSVVGLNVEQATKVFLEANDVCKIEIKRGNNVTKKLKLVKVERTTFLNKCVLGNCKDGKGQFIDISGNDYNGNFKNGQKNDFGKMIYSNGKTYTGNWINDYPNGKGKLEYDNGDFIEGNFVNGLVNGEGVYTAANGLTYTGNFLNGKFDGAIKQVFKNEESIVVYKNGVQVKSENATNKMVVVPETKMLDLKSFNKKLFIAQLSKVITNQGNNFADITGNENISSTFNNTKNSTVTLEGFNAGVIIDYKSTSRSTTYEAVSYTIKGKVNAETFLALLEKEIVPLFAGSEVGRVVDFESKSARNIHYVFMDNRGYNTRDIILLELAADFGNIETNPTEANCKITIRSRKPATY